MNLKSYLLFFKTKSESSALFDSPSTTFRDIFTQSLPLRAGKCMVQPRATHHGHSKHWYGGVSKSVRRIDNVLYSNRAVPERTFILLITRFFVVSPLL